MKLYFFLKDTDTIISPGPGGRVTHNKRIWKQSDSVLNTLEWNLHREFTEEESVELIKENELYYVAPLDYQESGNEVEVKFDKDLESDSSRTSKDESQSEEEEEEINDNHSVSNETITEDKEEQLK